MMGRKKREKKTHSNKTRPRTFEVAQVTKAGLNALEFLNVMPSEGKRLKVECFGVTHPCYHWWTFHSKETQETEFYSQFSLLLSFLLFGFNSSLTFTPQCWEMENKLDNSCKAPLRQNFCSGSCNKKHEQCRGFSHTCSRPWSNSGKFYQLPEQYCTVQDPHYKRISSIQKALHKSPFCCRRGQKCRTRPWTLVPTLSVQLPDSHIHEYPFESRLQQNSPSQRWSKSPSSKTWYNCHVPKLSLDCQGHIIKASVVSEY